MRSSLVVVVALLMSARAAGAQTLSLTEAEALQRLGEDSPRVRAARAVIDVVRADVAAARLWPNPRVTYDRESVAGVTEHLTMVGQLLPVSGARRFQVDAAEARVAAASRRADEEVRQLRAGLRAAFAALWGAQEQVRELTAARDRLQALAGVLAKREAAGDAAGFDRLRAEREVLDVDAALDLAVAEQARAHARLAGFFTDVPPGGIVAAGASASRAALPPLDELLARAEGVRGELAALEREIEAARFAERAAGRLRIPEPEVVGGTKTSNAAGGDVGSVVAVHVTVPLFDRGGPERARSRARASQAAAEIGAFRQVLRAEVTALRALVVERRAAADRHRTALGQAADALERIAQVSYDAGERGILELLDAFRSASDARVRQIALDLAVRQAEVELELASGWEIR